MRGNAPSRKTGKTGIQAKMISFETGRDKKRPVPEKPVHVVRLVIGHRILQQHNIPHQHSLHITHTHNASWLIAKLLRVTWIDQTCDYTRTVDIAYTFIRIIY